MRHRPLLATFAGLAGLLAVAPVFAAEQSPSPQPAPGAAADEAATANCGAPETTEVAAPAEDGAETFEAGEAGTVELERTSATDLRILSATPADGWVEKIATPDGPRVKGKFTNTETPDHVVKFAASLNSDGSVLRLKVTDCG